MTSSLASAKSTRQPSTHCASSLDINDHLSSLDGGTAGELKRFTEIIFFLKHHKAVAVAFSRLSVSDDSHLFNSAVLAVGFLQIVFRHVVGKSSDEKRFERIADNLVVLFGIPCFLSLLLCDLLSLVLQSLFSLLFDQPRFRGDVIGIWLSEQLQVGSNAGDFRSATFFRRMIDWFEIPRRRTWLKQSLKMWR